MSDRPIRPEVDADVEIPAPVRMGASMRVTKEQLAAAERTRDYHLRRLQHNTTHAERADTTVRSEH